MKLYSKLLFLSYFMISISSCKKENTSPTTTPVATTETPTETLVKIGETYILGANAKAIVYSSKALLTGYNELFVALYDSTDGSRLSNGHFDIVPMMTMGTMVHSAPVENTEDTLTTNGYFKSAVVFSMPGTSSQWSLKLMFHNHKNETFGEGALGVDVADPSPARFRSTVLALDSNASVFISYILPQNPKVGINDFEIILHKRETMMLFSPISNYAVEIVPEMPSMGHGSPNNVNPIHTENGHYKGKVNFTMTGLWQVKLKLSKNGTLFSSDQYFEITL